MNHTIARLLGAASLLLALATAHAADTMVYMKPGGNDQASGKSEADAVATLQMAVKRVLALPVDSGGSRKVMVLPGTYLAQTAVVADLPDDKPLVITGSTGAGQRPVFDGNGKGRAWLQLDSATGRTTRLTIEGIEVASYVTAISLNGNREAQGNFNAENVIHKNLFRDIGQIAFPSGKPSTAAVRLVNSRNNRITDNRFVNIRNNTGCGALHAIYIAHYSSGNLIEGNTFDGGCGAAVKTRDGSGGNMVKDNRFIDQTEPVFLDSFCNKDSRDDCTKETSECPSWGNEFKDNTTAKLGPKARKMPVQVAGPDSAAGCPPPPSRSSRRLQESNTRSGDR
ncbi:MAG: right-handed parallel beta-helix repeat-containing protein [Piscinibacter sp.]